jgi:hypothetical protein
VRRAARAAPRHLRLPVALASLVAGVGLLVFADGGWSHAVGIVCLFAVAVLTFVAAASAPDQGSSVS